MRIRPEEAVRRLAPGHGGWANFMSAYCGRECEVDGADASDDTIRIR